VYASCHTQKTQTYTHAMYSNNLIFAF
jgi:hypothetical protein